MWYKFAKLINKFLSYEQLRNWIRKNNITSPIQYENVIQKIPQQYKIYFPDKPEKIYKQWTSWRDFIGKEVYDQNVKNSPFVTYQEAKTWARNTLINNPREYLLYRKKPSNIPLKPDVVYKDQWEGWNEFLGQTKPIFEKILEKTYLPFEEIKKWMIKNHIHSPEEYNQRRMSLMPENPEKTYFGKWDWKDFKKSFKTQYAQSKININLPDYVWGILQDIKQHGAHALIIGGAVRDAILGIKSKDIDFEVYHMNYEDLVNLLSQYGKTDLVGKSFGVIKFQGPDGQDFDFSLPRLDSKNGVGHKDFNVQTSSNLTPEQAASRRDFTMNAIGYDPLTEEIIDPFGGIQDIKNKILKHTSESFKEDALRALRGMQFAARFGFQVDPKTAELIKSMKNEYYHLPKERIYEEWKKLAQKGIYPSKALDYLHQTGWDELYPHINALKNVKQEPEFHPEGDVHTHTKYVMDEAARIAKQHNLNPEETEILMYAALTHDYAKPATTQTLIKKGVPRITSHGHEEQGGPMARYFLESIGAPKHIIDKVVPLVENHLNHIHYSHSNHKDAFVKQLAERLHPSNINMLSYLIEADHSGRPPLPKKLPDEAQQLLTQSEELGAKYNKIPDLLQGKDVIKYTNGQGGPIVGQILKEARNLLLNHSPEMYDREKALNWLDKKMKVITGIINGNDVIKYTSARGPEISKILNEAWKAQKNGQFNDKQSALNWLNQFNGSK